MTIIVSDVLLFALLICHIEWITRDLLFTFQESVYVVYKNVVAASIKMPDFCDFAHLQSFVKFSNDPEPC